MVDPVSCIENIIENQNTINDKDKALKNFIDDKQASINVAAI